MKKEIIYRTQISVNNINTPLASKRVLLRGIITRCTSRKLLNIIPLPDGYKWEIEVRESIRKGRGYAQRPLNEDCLTFESRKRLAEERQNLEAWLRNKCKEYRMK